MILNFVDAKFEQLLVMWGGQRVSGQYFYDWLDLHQIEYKTKGADPIKIVHEITIDDKKFLEVVLRSK
jgi:hypothetical protein